MQELELSALVATIKQRNGLISTAECARFVGVTEKTMANWLHGRNYPDVDRARQLAGLAGVDADAFCAYVEAMRAPTPEGRETWLRVVRRLMTTAAFSVPAAMVLLAEETGYTRL